MGVCLSCLRQEEGDFGESTSLLNNTDNQYYSQQLQEEIIKKQQRQQELSNLVNELSDNLIDISSFVTNTTLNNSISNSTHSLNGGEKIYPYYVPKSEKDQIVADTHNLDQTIKEKCIIKNGEPLYLKF